MIPLTNFNKYGGYSNMVVIPIFFCLVQGILQDTDKSKCHCFKMERVLNYHIGPHPISRKSNLFKHWGYGFSKLTTVYLVTCRFSVLETVAYPLNESLSLCLKNLSKKHTSTFSVSRSAGIQKSFIYTFSVSKDRFRSFHSFNLANTRFDFHSYFNWSEFSEKICYLVSLS